MHLSVVGYVHGLLCCEDKVSRKENGYERPPYGALISCTYMYNA
jgi:hypothetical protein